MLTLPVILALFFLLNNQMNFKIILENNSTNKLTFATVEDCVDMDDLINHIHAEFPNHTIDQITQIN